MKFGPSRGNPLIIFEHFIKDFGLLLLAVLFAFWKGPDILLQNAQILVLVFINPIAALIKYVFTKYSITDEKMIINSGLFVKKTMEIPLQGITTVDLSQNLLFQLFHVYKIKADNSCQTNDTAKQAEVVLVLKKDTAFYVKNLLESKSDETNDTFSNHQAVETGTPIISCSVVDFLALGALQSKLLYFITIFSTVFGGGGYLYSFFSEKLHLNQLIEKFFDTFTPTLGIAFIILAAYITSLLSSMFLTAVRYYNYTVINRSDSLLISYGLFTKKSYTLMKEKISGINIKQSALMRLFGYCSVEVFIIGYGDKSEDSKQELSLIYPFAKLDQANNILVKLFPDMTFRRDYHKRAKGSLRYFFLSFRMFFAVGILLGVFLTLFALKPDIPYENIVKPAAIGISLFLLTLTIISVYLEYRNSGIYANHNVVSVCKGTFSHSMVYIKTKKLESVTEHTSIWKRKKGLTTIKLGFVAPLRVAHIKARNIAYQDYDAVNKVMDY